MELASVSSAGRLLDGCHRYTVYIVATGDLTGPARKLAAVGPWGGAGGPWPGPGPGSAPGRRVKLRLLHLESRLSTLFNISHAVSLLHFFNFSKIWADYAQLRQVSLQKGREITWGRGLAGSLEAEALSLRLEAAGGAGDGWKTAP